MSGRMIEAFSAREDGSGRVVEMQWTEHLGNGRRHRVELLEQGLVARGSIFVGRWVAEIEFQRASISEPFVFGCAPAPFREALTILRDIQLGGTGGFNTALSLPA